jgi:sodium transport system ATP-binding protein
MINIDSLSKNFGDVQAVKDISFKADDGQVTALLGPNGAGKSTTLRALYGVLAPSSGCVTIDGIDVTQDPQAARQRLGALPHNAGIYERLTTRENIAYFGQLNGMDKSLLNKRIDDLIEVLDMQDIADRRCAGFSQGQRVKVALARALVHEPQNILLDEPTNGLDVMAARAVRSIVSRLREAGKCVLFSSHMMFEIESLCDSLVIIAEGSLKFYGSLDQLRNQTGESDLEEAFLTVIGEKS